MMRRWTFTSILAILFTKDLVVQGVFVDAPSKENFVRRITSRATALGNYVYIEGGSIMQREDKTPGSNFSNDPRSDRILRNVESTLSIDMTSSWSSDTVAIRTIPKPGLQPRHNAVVITDAARGEYYVWGGSSLDRLRLGQDPAMYKFTVDGKGGGNWTEEAPRNWKATQNVEQAAYASTNEATFIIGGIVHAGTEPNRDPGEQAVPGMVTFDLKTKSFINDTATWISPSSTNLGGRAEFIPGFGRKGLIVVLGGLEPTLTFGFVRKQQERIDFHNLTFYDPEAKRWHWQVSTGDVPPPTPRHSFCSAGHQTPNGGFEILISGGNNPWGDGHGTVYSDAYILSLPGFFWTRVPDLSEPRKQHPCVPVGRRQILSVGGAPNEIRSDNTPNITDTAPQGLLLFDMTSLQWKHDYDANDSPYESTDTIKNWYRNGSLESVQWSSDTVRALFINDPSINPSDNTTNREPETADPPSTRPASTTAKIVGTTVGASLGLAVVGAAIWLYLGRKRAKKRNIITEYNGLGEYSTLEFNKSGNQPFVQEMPQDQGESELPSGRHLATELCAAEPAVELPTWSARQGG